MGSQSGRPRADERNRTTHPGYQTASDNELYELRLKGGFGEASTPFLPLLHAEIICSYLRRPVAHGLLVRFRAPSGNLRHDDVAIFDRWRAREQFIVPREARSEER